MERTNKASPAVLHLLGLIGNTPIMINEELTTIGAAYDNGLLNEQRLKQEALRALQKLGEPSDGALSQRPSTFSVPPFTL